MRKETEYRYNSFTLGTVIADMAFNGGTQPGERIGKISLPSTNGEPFEWPHQGSRRLLLLVLGSRSCPATISSIPDIKKLYAQYQNEIEFAYLYVREAHPGECIPQSHTLQDKTAQACALQAEHDIPWKIAVDTLDGEVHHRLATRPNAAYLIDDKGTVIFRTLFAADAKAIGQAIEQHLQGQFITKPDRSPVVYPVLKLIGLMWAVLDKAGKTAQRDLLIRTPFIYVPSRIAAMLKNSSAFARGSVAMVLTFAVPPLVIWLLVWLF